MKAKLRTLSRLYSPPLGGTGDVTGAFYSINSTLHGENENTFFLFNYIDKEKTHHVQRKKINEVKHLGLLKFEDKILSVHVH